MRFDPLVGRTGMNPDLPEWFRLKKNLVCCKVMLNNLYGKIQGDCFFWHIVIDGNSKNQI
uniref:Uncharacterized protein n=1 Tax=Manihot esculenta TaxID=3983 RepID=A0A2C9V4F0_MANES